MILHAVENAFPNIGKLNGKKHQRTLHTAHLLTALLLVLLFAVADVALEWFLSWSSTLSTPLSLSRMTSWLEHNLAHIKPRTDGPHYNQTVNSGPRSMTKI